MQTPANPNVTNPDVLLIGTGIMSATLGVLLKELQPQKTIEIVERLTSVAVESTDAWNNAGTGHAAFCELNYTPEKADGSVDVSKAIKISESFEISRQFWAFLVESGFLKTPESFIRQTPHMSFVWGEKNVEYLKKRFDAMQSSPLFQGMKYSEDRDQLAQWMPLVMEGRDAAQKVAATRMEIGTDINFGALTRALIAQIQGMEGVALHLGQEVKALQQESDGRWRVEVKEQASGKTRIVRAKFIFIGAGGGSLPLLLKSGIPEGKGFGGFPVSGQWLKCTNPQVIERHSAKVYGKASVGAPPMSVPHLDTRIIDGKKALLFGPYAGFTTKFLKQGSLLDLPLSIKPSNMIPMLCVGRDNIPLTKYLIDQVRQSPEDRLVALREFFPDAKKEDWQLEIAGQRVQVIKKDPKRGGVLEFGTEVVSASDGSLAALLGASPGASTTISIMLTLLERCFKDEMSSPAWRSKLQKMIPSFGQSLASDAELCERTRKHTGEILGLNQI
ncbi:malate:quinone oxidoreductase [Abditibacterium utsteinense]|nr:malate:quinone oxidoreductase [Abditibacterium utsteinense]